MSDRQNAQGSPCPPWCVTDHDRYHFHASGSVQVETRRYHQVSVRAIRYSSASSATSVQVALVRMPHDDAEDFAALVEELADATPERHRELAAAIRSAAAVAAGDASQEQGAEDCSDDH